MGDGRETKAGRKWARGITNLRQTWTKKKEGRENARGMTSWNRKMIIGSGKGNFDAQPKRKLQNEKRLGSGGSISPLTTRGAEKVRIEHHKGEFFT